MKNLLAVVSLAAAMSTSAWAQTETINIWASGSSTPDAVTLNAMGNGQFGFDFTGTDKSVAETFLINGQSVTLNLTTLVFDSDPSVRFAFGVNNPDGATGTTPYSFTFQTPVTLAAGDYTVHSSISGSLTKGVDGNTDPVVLSLPGTGGDVMQSFVGAGSDAGGKQNAGVDLIDSAVSVDPTEGNSQPFNATGFSSPTLGFTLGSTASQISVTTTFQLSNSDSASFSGRFDIVATPEPRSLALGLLCAGLFAWMAARKRRA